jgi:hypothetical protein
VWVRSAGAKTEMWRQIEVQIVPWNAVAGVRGRMAFTAPIEPAIRTATKPDHAPMGQSLIAPVDPQHAVLANNKGEVGTLGTACEVVRKEEAEVPTQAERPSIARDAEGDVLFGAGRDQDRGRELTHDRLPCAGCGRATRRRRCVAPTVRTYRAIGRIKLRWLYCGSAGNKQRPSRRGWHD